MDVNKRAERKDAAKDIADFAIKVSNHLKQKHLTSISFLQSLRLA